MKHRDRVIKIDIAGTTDIAFKPEKPVPLSS
jgi:hypothetical protein